MADIRRPKATPATPLIVREERTPGGTVRARSTLGVRWLVLAFTCILMMGSYYCYDNPAALESQLHARFADTPYNADFAFWFNMFYTVYSVPNIVLPFFGGYFVDKLGVRFMLVLFAALILLGQIIVALSTQIRSLPLMLVGRFIFGLGGESLCVGQSALLAAWFKDKELALALGISMSISRLGSVVNDSCSPMLAGNIGLSGALWVGAIICAGSLGAALCLVTIDSCTSRREAADAAKAAAAAAGTSSAAASLFSTPRPDRLRTPGVKRSAPGQGAPAYGSVQRSDNGSEPNTPNAAEGPNGKREKMKLSDVRHLGIRFWLLCISCVVVYGAILPFNNIASGLLQVRAASVLLARRPAPPTSCISFCARAPHLTRPRAPHHLCIVPYLPAGALLPRGRVAPTWHSVHVHR